MTHDASIRRGRFAPSPTGPLHFGSLVTAVASYCEARALRPGEARPERGQWLLRIEDVDTPRTVAGAADALLSTLDALGFEWDGPVVCQSRRTDAYAAALGRLQATGAVFPCACTRKEIADSLLRPPSPADELVYPGTCRDGLPPGRCARATRVRAHSGSIEFHDRVQGRIVRDLARDIGDFVVRCADRLFAYQLAVVVDDADQSVTDGVRGADLLDSAPRQIFLQRLLGLHTPRYAHVPVAVNSSGEKLSKQTLAPAIDASRGAQELAAALAFLGQEPPADLGKTSVAETWNWALNHWTLERVPRMRAIRPE